MSRAWRNPRQVIVHQIPVETEDTLHCERLVGLLAMGLERLLAHSESKGAELVDFNADVLPDTCAMKENTERVRS